MLVTQTFQSRSFDAMARLIARPHPADLTDRAQVWPDEAIRIDAGRACGSS
jgi:hypothetical protein